MTSAAARPIELAYSCDADDAFMFHALAKPRVDLRGLVFHHRRADTARLNEIARAGAADVVAVSVGVLPWIVKRYLLLPHGASVGRGFGPVVVARTPTLLGALSGKRVAIPGADTTAWLVLRLMQQGLVPVVIPISPFANVFTALDRGDVDAALVIHEGRLLYEKLGYHLVADLGQWWAGETGLPLPLGANVICRDLDDDLIADVSRVLADAIVWADTHRDEVIATLADTSPGHPWREPGLLHQYLSMYANHDTVTTAQDVRTAIDVLFQRATRAGLLRPENQISIEWAP